MGEIVVVGVSLLLVFIILYFLINKNYTLVINTILVFYMIRGTVYRISYNLMAWRGYDITIFAIEFAIIICFIYSLLDGKITIKHKISLLFMIFMFYLWLFISAVFTCPNWIVGLYGIRWVVIPPLFMFFVNKYRNQINFYSVLYTLLILTFINILYAIVQSLYFPPFDYPSEVFTNPVYRAILKGQWVGMDLPIMIGNRIRPYGMLSNIVIFNNTIPMIIIFFMIISVHDSKLKRYIQILLLFYFIYLSINFYEKAQILTVGIGTVVFSIFMLKVKKNIVLPLIYMLIVVFIAFSGVVYAHNVYKEKETDPYMKRLMEVFDPVEGTGKHRIGAWYRSFNRFLEKPWGWGVGYARSTSVSKGLAIYPHNMFLQFLIEGGIIGFFMFVFIYLYMMYFFTYFGIRGNYYSLAFAVVLISIGIYGLGTSFFERLNSFIFWLLFYIAYNSIRKRNHEENID